MNISLLVIVYSVTGLLFGLFFLFRGYTKLDASAQGASFGVRVMWVPAAIVLWPLLLVKIFKVSSS